MTRFQAATVLEQLKDFQRETVDVVFDRMYVDQPVTHRFLVADEVGLGKTLVARGVIAKTIEHLQDRVERIDIVYVCSNAQIAKQNVRRLRVGEHENFELADRLTMLPVTAHELGKNRVNVVSFTPGTSFDLKGGGGMAKERAVLRMVLREVWGRDRFSSRGSMRVFQGGVQKLETFRSRYQATASQYGRLLDPGLIQSFAQTLEIHDKEALGRGEPALGERFEELLCIFGTDRPKTGWSPNERSQRSGFVGDLRDLLARACLEALQPDLIILDEFQRFKHLLAAPGSEQFGPAAELAHELFSYVDTKAEHSPARVLLLSATPYKMLTSSGDPDEDHHADFVDTAQFLMGHDEMAVADLTSGLRDLRQGLLQAGRDGGVAAKRARDQVQRVLLKVMVRTERLSATSHRSAMLAELPCTDLRLESPDVGRFVGIARLARHLGVYDPLEYWKSAPYLLNYMDNYRLDQEFDRSVAGRTVTPSLVRRTGLLPWERIDMYEPVEAESSRLRWLLDTTVGEGAWQLLWVPPSLPYLSPGGPFADPVLEGFTKRLLFSSWTVVPKAVATLVTYEAERQMVSASGTPAYQNNVQGRQARGRLLDFAFSGGRLTGMPVLAILYPSVVLSRVGDPLGLCADAGAHLVEAEDAVRIVSGRLQPLIDNVRAEAERTSGLLPVDGPVDQAWYWAAPIWLDWLEEHQFTDEFFANGKRVASAYSGPDEVPSGDRFIEHIEEARKAALDEQALGRMPDDLAEVLARMALAGPGVCALRALSRVTGRPVGDLGLRFGACRVAWGLRGLFNGPEVTELVRGPVTGEPYWQRVLRYGLAGNLQSVLDEYAHVLVEAQGHLDSSDTEVVDDLAGVMHDATELRTVNYGVKRIQANQQSVTVKPDRLRANFAVRLSDERADDGSESRVAEVRNAFNSPFRPFLLTTTSAGQEGLDFHPFCHAIVHWNLPGNPVDLEQREGRIHRYKGHAVRRNLAATYSEVGRGSTDDPWVAMFDAACHDREPSESEIVPFWVYLGKGEAKIERYVPTLPLSREVGQLSALKRSLVLYRLAFGQPRQEDLLEYLADQMDPEDLERLVAELRIDLSPAASRGDDEVDGGIR